jgi:hypothetical protein
VAKKGFYLKNNPKENCLYLNVFVSDFKAFLDTIPQSNGWVRLRIFERQESDLKGHTHNMEFVVNPKHIKEQGGDDE